MDLTETKWRTHLLENGWKQDEKSFVILDEAQMSYGDVGLWGEFFKELRCFKDQFAIAFASYGSPTSPFTIEGTPMFVVDLQRVTLQAIDHNDGFGAVGLLFSPEEFNDLIHKQFSPPRYYFITSISHSSMPSFISPEAMREQSMTSFELWPLMMYISL